MNFKRLILLLQVGFLLTIFGAATFYLQYASVKKSYTVSSSKDDSASDENNPSVPMTEEGNETSGNSAEEEEENNDRSYHELDVLINTIALSVVKASTAHLFSFSEIHFEIITPPPQA